MSARFDPSTENVLKLTLKFMKAVSARQADKTDNMVLSPYNALMCLSMIAKGAAGDTREEMAQTLFGISGAELDKAAADLMTLNTRILDDSKHSVTLKTANGAWVNSDRGALKHSYSADLQQNFGATIDERSFKDPATLAAINQWASDNTNKLITKILDQLDPGMLMVISSALYFKGDWTKKFDKALTKDREFKNDDGSVAKTPTMHQDYRSEGGFTYLQGSDYQAVAMTYGEQDWQKGATPSTRIVLIRPADEKQSARNWLESQPEDTIPQWMDSRSFSHNVVGSIELPHIELKQEFDLIPALNDMGIKKVFTGAADMSAMANGGLLLSAVKHDVVFKTNEEGSEAAAITTGVMRATSIRPMPQRVDMKLDRSFVLAVQDIKSGAILFSGVVSKPNNDMKPAI